MLIWYSQTGILVETHTQKKKTPKTLKNPTACLFGTTNSEFWLILTQQKVGDFLFHCFNHYRIIELSEI